MSDENETAEPATKPGDVQHCEPGHFTELKEIIPRAPINLLKALVAARAEMKFASKSGHNKFDNYEYATLEDYIQQVNGPFCKHGLVLISNPVEVRRMDDRHTASGKLEHVVWVKMELQLYHAESGETLPNPIIGYGEGQDRADKAIYKAMTGARKYAIANLCNLYTTDDPEKDESVGDALGPDPQQTRRSAAAKQEPQQARRSAPAGKPGQKAERAADPPPPPPPADRSDEKIEAQVLSGLASVGGSPAQLYAALQKCHKEPKPGWEPGTRYFAKTVEVAGKQVEQLIQAGAWKEEECVDLHTLLSAMNQTIDTDKQAKGFF